jgi:hypothetical protein
MAGTVAPNIVTDGLVLYLDAANIKSYVSGSTTWNDLSINRRNGILTNGPTFDPSNGGSIVFDGVDDTGVISNANLTGFTEITINVWYYSNSATSQALTRSFNVGNAFILHYRGAGFYLVASDGTVSEYLGWQTSPPALQWVMLTARWRLGIMSLYQNGIKQTNERSFAGGTTGILASINTIQLGYFFNSFQSWTNGKISNFQIYNRALSDSEILQNYNATKTRFGL